MEVLKIIDITRKDVPLYYRNNYKAVAELSLADNAKTTTNIEFAVEVTPISGKVYTVEEMDEMDYPSIPIKKALVELIKQYDREGLLP